MKIRIHEKKTQTQTNTYKSDMLLVQDFGQCCKLPNTTYLFVGDESGHLQRLKYSSISLAKKTKTNYYASL